MQANAQMAIAKASTAECKAARVLNEPALFILSILLMVSFSVFPRGYMPARTASGFTIVLCSGFGLKSKAVDAPAETPRRHIGSEKCDMVGAAAILPPPAAFIPPVAAPVALSLWSVRSFAIRFLSAFDPNAPPTAPPLLTI